MSRHIERMATSAPVAPPAPKPKRVRHPGPRAISVCARTYRRIATEAKRRGVPLAQIVTELLERELSK